MILLTGATGYIGSHTWLALHAAGYAVAGIDDFSNSSPEVLVRLAALGADVSHFTRADVHDRAALDAVFAKESIDAVVHFAASKAVGDSVAQPLAYYANNVGGLIALAEAMQAHGCKTIVFSSSATVYAETDRLPIAEDAAQAASSPYASTKLVSEGILRDVERSDPAWRIALLRYFNPVGAHESGTIGEDPRGVPNNLMPYVAQVAIGKRPTLRIFGNDYATHDGTGVRDYLHVVDLAEGHVAALRHLLAGGASVTLNLGTGRGSSVLDLVHAFERAIGRPIPVEYAARRPGDLAAYYGDASLAERTLGWKARRDLDAMCADSWRWQSANPNGYGD
jgi:UDP-glucose 4-epimerase